MDRVPNAPYPTAAAPDGAVNDLGQRYNESQQQLERARTKIARLKRERGILLDKIRALSGNGMLSSSTGLSSSEDEREAKLKTAATVKRISSGKGRVDRGRTRRAASSDDHQNDAASAPKTKQNKRKLQAAPKDDEGRLVLPFVDRLVTVHSLGTIDLREGYHTRNYIFPVGYKSTKKYMSVHDPDSETLWNSCIEDGGDAPRFVLIPEDKPDEPIVGTSATAVWTAVIKAAHKLRGKEHRSSSVSGPEHYGLTIPTVKAAIQSLPNADLCKHYERSKWDESTGDFLEKKGAEEPTKRSRKRKTEALTRDDGASASPAMSPGTVNGGSPLPPPPTQPQASTTSTQESHFPHAAPTLPAVGLSAPSVGLTAVSAKPGFPGVSPYDALLASDAMDISNENGSVHRFSDEYFLAGGDDAQEEDELELLF